ncbi:MAG: patatin-like phospholipase family protein, partial [Ignavibacteria bacterium]|nr:patatin-like phospholipase family protein [Ignavibacteria bacterium]
SQLPIPFLCVACDLTDGSNVVLSNGVLSKAVRASMSLPSFFSPVKIDGRLLVDGGVINNFPVEEVKQKGVNTIIGVDVQSGLYGEAELNSVLTILEQVTSFYRVSANNKAVSMTDIYINPMLDKYQIMDFDDYDTIMKIGELAAREFFPQLKALADSLNSISEKEPIQYNTQPLDSIFITYIQYNGLKRVSREFLDGALDIDLRTWVKLNDLDEGFKRAYGSGFFENINYYLFPTEDGVGLVLNITESSSGTFGVGIHYDSDYNVSLLLNSTFKNVGIKGSKWFTDLSLGENPRFKSLYLVDRGSKIGFGSRLTFFNLELNEYDNNNVVDVLMANQNMAEAFAQWTYRNTMRFQAGAAFEYTRIKSSFNEQIPDDYNSNLIGFINWSIDSYDKNQFSTSGHKLDISVKYILPLGQDPANKVFSNSLIFSIKHFNNIHINNKNTFKPGIIAGFTAIDSRPPPQHYFIVGGQSQINYFDAFIPFTGLRFVENTGLYTLIGNIAWQYTLHKNLYITAKWNLGFVTSTFEELMNKPILLSGFGVTFSYNSYIGPIELSLMGSNVNSGMS